MKLQVSSYEGTPSSPSEQLVIPLLRSVSDKHGTEVKILYTLQALWVTFTFSAHITITTPAPITLTGPSVTTS